MPTQIPTLEEIKAANREAFREVLSEELPKAIRKASRPDYLTTNDLKDIFGFSFRKQAGMRASEAIGYVQHGRKILYPIEEFEKWAEEHSVNINKIDNRQ
jgi:hypothetical protein